ncbi:MAG: LysR family transcriptional regulator [Oscillospiraceae bacterium]|nr:LysR family transcriptional regulator [Oscillospiraceae bacterium]
MYSITFQQVAAFLEVAETLNITAAAENTYVSQAALSRMIQRLEEGLEVKLFTRRSRGISLTPEGRLFYDRIRVPFDSICNAIEEIRDLKEGSRSILKVGVPSTININEEYSQLSDIVAEYNRLHPEVYVEVSIYEAGDLYRIVSLGNADVVFLQSFMLRSSNKLKSVPIFDLSTCIAVRKDNPAIRGDALNMALLQKQPLFTLASNMDYANVDNYLRSVRASAGETKDVPNFETLMYSVEHSDGYAYVGKIRSSGFHNLRLFPFNDGKPTHQLCMVWKEDAESETVRRFTRYICRRFQVGNQ